MEMFDSKLFQKVIGASWIRACLIQLMKLSQYEPYNNPSFLFWHDELQKNINLVCTMMFIRSNSNEIVPLIVLFG